MNTVQRYSGKGNYVSPTSPTAQNAASIPATADNRLSAPPLSPAAFIARHPELVGLPVDRLDDQLRELLPAQPVSYDSQLDGFNFLQELLPHLATSPNCHLALLLRGNMVISFVCVNLNDSLPEAEAAAFLSLDSLDSGYLISRLSEAGATGLLLISSRDARRSVLETDERDFIDHLQQGLTLMSVALVDWLLLLDGQAVSARSLPAAAPDPVLVEVFLVDNTDLMGLEPEEVATRLTERLQAQPVQYTSVLDGIALLRAFTPEVTAYPSTHYGLLLNGWTIIGFVSIPAQVNRLEDMQPLICYSAETRALMRLAMNAQADKVVLVSTRTDSEYWITNQELQEMDRLSDALEIFDIELLDYLLFYNDRNVSFAFAQHGELGLDDEVTNEALENHYVAFAQSIHSFTAE